MTGFWTWVAKSAARSLVAAILIVVLIASGIYLTGQSFYRHTQAIQAKTEATVTSAELGAAKETTRIIETHTENLQRINTITKESSDAIKTAPGSLSPIDPALHSAGIIALCLHDNQRDPVCALMLHRDDADQGTPGTDPARSATK